MNCEMDCQCITDHRSLCTRMQCCMMFKRQACAPVRTTHLILNAVSRHSTLYMKAAVNFGSALKLSVQHLAAAVQA